MTAASLLTFHRPALISARHDEGSGGIAKATTRTDSSSEKGRASRVKRKTKGSRRKKEGGDDKSGVFGRRQYWSRFVTTPASDPPLFTSTQRPSLFTLHPFQPASHTRPHAHLPPAPPSGPCKGSEPGLPLPLVPSLPASSRDRAPYYWPTPLCDARSLRKPVPEEASSEGNRFLEVCE